MGGWLVVTKHELPLSFSIDQGVLTGRKCRLFLTVDSNQQIFVAGNVIEIGRGEIEL